MQDMDREPMSPDSLASWIAYLWLMSASILFAIAVFVGFVAWGTEKAVNYSVKKWKGRRRVEEE